MLGHHENPPNQGKGSKSSHGHHRENHPRKGRREDGLHLTRDISPTSFPFYSLAYTPAKALRSMDSPLSNSKLSETLSPLPLRPPIKASASSLS